MYHYISTSYFLALLWVIPDYCLASKVQPLTSIIKQEILKQLLPSSAMLGAVIGSAVYPRLANAKSMTESIGDDSSSLLPATYYNKRVTSSDADKLPSTVKQPDVFYPSW